MNREFATPNALQRTAPPSLSWGRSPKEPKPTPFLMRCTRFLIVAALLSVWEVACSSHQQRPEKLLPAVSSWADTGLSHNLADLLKRIEGGDMKAWSEFAAYVDGGLDGEHSETYSMACGELARRDPTIFLRRHLLGDPHALRVGKLAYGWIGMEGRHTMNWLHESRLQLASDLRERRLIENYISALYSVLASIDRRYR